MGKSLGIIVKKEKKTIAAIYYHWSAKTISAFYEAKRLLDAFDYNKDMNNKEVQLALIRACEQLGGGVFCGYQNNERNYVQSLYPEETFLENIGYSNRGWIALSESEIKEIQRRVEGNLFIDLDDSTICTNVCWEFKDLEEYNDFLQSYNAGPIQLEDIQELPVDIVKIKYEDLDKAINYLKGTDQGVLRYRDYIYGIIA